MEGGKGDFSIPLLLFSDLEYYIFVSYHSSQVEKY